MNNTTKDLVKLNKDLMKENKELRRMLDKKDETITIYMDRNVDNNERIMELEQGVEHSKSKSASILSTLGHLTSQSQ